MSFKSFKSWVVQVNEEHLVHVNDGSKYGDKPHDKDVEHVMAGAKKYNGEHDGNSDKGAFFKFKSHEDAKAFKRHVDSCPHKTCDADLNEEVKLEEATVKTQKYSWGTMKTIHHGSSFSIPLHPEHHHEIAKLSDEQEHKFKDETGRHWTARRKGEDVHFHSANDGPKTVVKHSALKEDVAQIDEISDKTLGNYINAAKKDRENNKINKAAPDTAQKISANLRDKKRIAGMNKAKSYLTPGTAGYAKNQARRAANEEVELDETWSDSKYKNPEGGLTKAGVMAYRRENPGSHLQTAVRTDPSKLKPGSKKAKRRLSFCRRMKGMKKKLTSAKTARDPDSRINKSLRAWNC